MVRRPGIRFVLITVLIALASRGAHAGPPWFLSYERALEAQERGDWQASIRFLNEAIAEKSAPKQRARTYGMRFVDYFPYYHMGVAYFNLHDKANALTYFARSEKLGEVTDAEEEHAAMIKMKGDLTGLRNEQHPRVSVIEKPPGDTAVVVAATGTQNLPQNLPWYVNYETGLAYLESGDWVKAIENLSSALADNNHPREFARTYGMWFITYQPYYYLGEAYYNQTLWRSAVKYFESSVSLEEIEQGSAEYRRRDSLLARARHEAGRSRPGAEELRESLTLGLSEAITLYNNEEYTEAEARFLSILHLDPYNSVARNYLKKLTTGAKARPGSPAPNVRPDNYMAGVFEYFKGNYAKSIELLASVRAEHAGEPDYHAYLGAAFASQYIAGGTKEKTVLRKAETAFRKAVALQASYRMDPRIFPGDVIGLFQQARKKVQK